MEIWQGGYIFTELGQFVWMAAEFADFAGGVYL